MPAGKAEPAFERLRVARAAVRTGWARPVERAETPGRREGPLSRVIEDRTASTEAPLAA